ncbi:MAG: adenylate kinase family protein [Actinomycetota bacterium]
MDATGSDSKVERVFVLGPPASGKTTQAQRVATSLGLRHLSMGDALRDAVAQGTPMGARARSSMERGELVPDEVVVAVLGEHVDRADERGFVLDGFPRDVEQAEVTGAVVGRPDLVVHLAIPDDEVVRRIAGRRSCPSCARIYHLEDRPPGVPDRCDDDGEPLVRRPDDRRDVVLSRLAVYRERTEPVIRHYGAAGVLVEVDGTGEISQVTARILGALGA